MKIKIALEHQTTYRYDRSARLGPQVVRLRPAPHCLTTVSSYSLQVLPKEHFLNWQQDPQGNYLARVVVPEPTREFTLSVDLIAELETLNPFDFFLEPSAEQYPFEYERGLRAQLAPYLAVEPQGKRFEKYLASLDRTQRQSVDYCVAFNQRINQDLEYVLRYEHGLQTPEKTLELGRGACRDFAWLQVQLLRRLGLAARFVSGYSIQLVADVKALDGPAGVAQDIVDLHAWAEVYLPGAGWIGMDGTCGLLAGEGHLPLACTADPVDAAPVTGALEDCEVEFETSMRVTRLAQGPRSTLPYDEPTWERILARGAEVEERLLAGDVRLTQGGEPTFVSIDDYLGEEWTVGALGEEKRRLAEVLLRRLRRAFAPGALLHFGQGKWYPGESLPRWSLACMWRTDGEPMWRDERLLAAHDDSTVFGPDEAADFARGMAQQLGVSPDNALPAYEDVSYYLWREGRLPVNVDVSDPKLTDAEERRRLARAFEHGLGEPAGYVLPIERRSLEGKMVWYSSLWMLQGRRVFLVPGDSPVGLRLPLGSLPWAEPGDVRPFFPQDPLESRGALPHRANIAMQRASASVPRKEPDARGTAPAEAGESAEDVVRTALTVEARDGQLFVFLPPTTCVEEFLELVTAAEETAASLETPVVLEGYLPPSDHRLSVLRVTPDPGVIEVNVQPAATWDELVRITTDLYEEARLTRLGTVKFLVDGREVGTGGGNHLVLGGPTPADSPFLRRPQLLRSILVCWNNHPSLSYLFSSLFLGPTSQAPRLDEARQDLLYELEIALSQVPDSGDVPAWLVDRLFRHLLVDVAGNTHRAEICIDKLYSPDSSTGRLGLVEFRSFEMPPHARMSLVQQLLLRSIVAVVWDDPWPVRLQRFGANLHDRFMLPHFVWQDLANLLSEIERRGVALDLEWFRPQLDFRFPFIGRVAYQGVELELRSALEPWHVLGEEPVGGATARFVDSSVERIQVRVSGSLSERYGVACNGVEVPLHPTGTEGEFVAGVRYRAWQPAHCLHPTIAPHVPLVFDVFDRWSERSVGGCRYHVAHPGGRNYDTPPVNHNEAEARRRARFEPFGHTQGQFVPRRLDVGPERPLTLDLRRS